MSYYCAWCGRPLADDGKSPRGICCRDTCERHLADFTEGKHSEHLAVLQKLIEDGGKYGLPACATKIPNGLVRRDGPRRVYKRPVTDPHDCVLYLFPDAGRSEYELARQRELAELASAAASPDDARPSPAIGVTDRRAGSEGDMID